MNRVLGDILKNAREEQKLSLDDLAKETKIQKRYLIDLENESFDDMPGKVYERGFLKTYASILGLDVNVILDLHDQIRGEKREIVEETPKEHSVEKTHQKGKLKIFLWVIIAVFVAFGVVKVLEIIDKRSSVQQVNVIAEEDKSNEVAEPKETEEVAADIPKSEIEEVAATTEAAIAPKIAKKVEVKLTGKVWLQVFVNGAKQKEGEFNQGENLVFEGSETDQIFVKIGNIKNADVYLNGVAEDESTAYKNVWKKTF